MHLGDVRRGISVKLLTNLIIFFMRREGKEMMAMLWAQQIMLGKKTFAQVPRLLKEQTKEVLIDSGYEELVTED